MALKEYKLGSTFPGRMGRTIGESEAAWPSPLRAKEGEPNVLFIVIDDTGFGHLGCYGSPTDALFPERFSGARQEPNWVPAPKDQFSFYIRSYWPKAEILEGRWTPPPVVASGR